MVRDDFVPPGYTASGHMVRTGILAALIFFVAIRLAGGAPWWAWLFLPLSWVFANFFEWTVHRYPMHRRLHPRIMYRNHAQLHHLAFTDQRMTVEHLRQLSLVMMPWYTIVMLFAAVSPVALLLGLIGGRELAGVFYLGAISYFLFYETLHALYHLRPETLARLPLLGPASTFARLRAHHARHHVLRRMAHANFNVTVPLTDWVMKTRDRGDEAHAAGESGGESEASGSARTPAAGVAPAARGRGSAA
jgi:hypothetical protein